MRGMVRQSWMGSTWTVLGPVRYEEAVEEFNG